MTCSLIKRCESSYQRFQTRRLDNFNYAYVRTEQNCRQKYLLTLLLMDFLLFSRIEHNFFDTFAQAELQANLLMRPLYIKSAMNVLMNNNSKSIICLILSHYNGIPLQQQVTIIVTPQYQLLITNLKIVEMQEDRSLKPKQNKTTQSSIQAEANKTKNLFSSNIERENDSASKSSTKFPPLKNPKNEDNPMGKTSQFPVPVLQRKITQPQKKSGNLNQTGYVARKFNIKRKTQKKKPLQQQFKPQLVMRYEQYMNFLSYINISNNLKINSDELEQPYVLYVGKGNNGSLIKNIFKNYRPWWVLEQSQPEDKTVNLFWSQLRQNHVLESFKQVSNTEEFDKLDFYREQGDMQEKNTEDKSRDDSRSSHRFFNQRSQSLISKDAPSFMARKLDSQSKRNVSRSKNQNRSSQKYARQSPSVKNHNIKQLKSEVIESQIDNTQKKLLTNPKMWPIYFMYRKIFSNADMRKLKKMGVIQQDGRIQGRLMRTKTRVIENRSNHIRMHNHLQNNWNLSNKKALFVNIRHYFQALKINPFDYIPMTFHVEKIGDKEYESFVEEYHRRCELIAQQQKNNKKSQYKTVFKPKKRNAWLVKPGENTNRGNGIQVVESLEQIKQIIAKDNIDSEGRPRTHIIQEYIMPFLYQKRKFDIRCYILITSVNGVQKGYWYQDGYIRTACKQFNMKNLANRMIHLTNDAVQKKCQDYGKFEPGNKLSFSDFQRYLDTNYNSIQSGNKLKFFQQAYPEMKKLATEAIKSVYTKINPTKKQFTFQIFGLDFLIDENFKVWLIQANTNPCLELSSPLLGRIIPSMLENAFKIAVDPLFPPPTLTELAKSGKKFLMTDNTIQSNKFELVFDDAEQGPQLKTLLTNVPDVPIYNIQQQQEEYADSDRENCNDY